MRIPHVHARTKGIFFDLDCNQLIPEHAPEFGERGSTNHVDGVSVSLSALLHTDILLQHLEGSAVVETGAPADHELSIEDWST